MKNTGTDYNLEMNEPTGTPQENKKCENCWAKVDGGHIGHNPAISCDCPCHHSTLERSDLELAQKRVDDAKKAIDDNARLTSFPPLQAPHQEERCCEKCDLDSSELRYCFGCPCHKKEPTTEGWGELSLHLKDLNQHDKKKVIDIVGRILASERKKWENIYENCPQCTGLRNQERSRIIALAEGMKSKDGGGEDYDEIENKDYNSALTDLINAIKKQP